MLTAVAVVMALPRDWNAWLAAGILGAFAGINWYLSYSFVGEIETSTKGIENRRFGRVARIAWTDLRRVEQSFGGLRLTGSTAVFRIEQQLTGYLELYEQIRRHAPAAFGAAPQVPFTVRASRFILLWMGATSLLLNVIGFRGLVSGHEIFTSLVLIGFGLLFVGVLCFSLPLSFHFDERALRLEYALRQEVYPWRNLQSAMIQEQQGQVVLALEFSHGKQVLLAAGGVKMAPLDIYHAIQAILAAQSARFSHKL